MKFLERFMGGKIKKMLGVDNLKPSGKSRRQMRKELKKLEQSRLKELNSRHAARKFNVSGVTYENRQQLLDTIVRRYSSEGVDRIEFMADPDNKYDPNAIKILFKDVGHIGYVPKEIAVSIGKLLDANTYDIKWDIDYFYNNDSDDEGIAYMEIRLYRQKQ